MGYCLNTVFDDKFTRNFISFIPTLSAAVIFDFFQIVPLFGTRFSNSIQTVCELDVKSECGNSQPFTSVTNHTVNHSQIVSNYEYLCTSNETQSIIDTIASTENCSNYYDLDILIDLCGKTEDNVFCVQHLENGEVFDSALYINQECRQLYLQDGSINSTSLCHSECRSVLNNTLQTLGCCANNLFNDRERFKVNTALWDHCGLPILQSCANTLTLPAVQSGSKVTRACKTLTIFVSTLSVIVTLIVLLY